MDVHYIGKINLDIYRCITEDITTDEVVITEERIRHIKNGHADDLKLYGKYIPDIIGSPDYIIKSDKPCTAIILKAYK